MNFKTKKLRKKLPKYKNSDQKPEKSRKSTKHYKVSIPIIGSIIIIIVLFVGIAKALTSIDIAVLLEIAGDELKQDAFGHTNFMLLGNGGKDHEGGNLMDTIIIASLDTKNSLVTMLSIPRDLYVEDELTGNSKINESYYRAKLELKSSTEGINHMKEKVEEIVGVPIHYWVKINFDGFKDLVDALGGIDIEVPEAIYDPYYPKDGTFEFEPFSISAGPQQMNGEVALKYARSRKTTSDFNRAARQQQIIYALKEKALKTDTLFSQDKLKNILNALKKNIETNIKVKEILTMGSFTKDFSPDQIAHQLIHDDPAQCGGFVYTPIRENYGGQFVLIPAGSPDFIHRYSDLIFNTPKILPENDKIQILNGTPTGGIAGETKQILQRYCFDVVRYGNGRNQEVSETTYYYKELLDENGKPKNTEPLSIQFIQKMIPGKVSTNIPTEYLEAGYFNKANIVIELGTDYANSPDYIDDPFYYLLDAELWGAAAKTTETTETNETE